MKCPSCGATGQEGKFCAQCGAALQGSCPSCGAALAPGSRFCTKCGTPAGAPPAGARAGIGGVGWPWIAGAAVLLVVVVMLFLPDRVAEPEPRATSPGAAPLGGAPPVSGDGLLSGDMRTNADRLFNRIMAAAEQGNEAEVAQFMPMAIQAYGMVEDLDHDGLFHLAILHRTAGAPDQAMATAERILSDAPQHILALGVAAAAAADAGDTARANELHRRLLDAYPAEAAKPLPEYVDHQRMLPEYRRAAQEALGQGG